MKSFMEDDLQQLNKWARKRDEQENKTYGIMDKSINELIALWIHVNKNIYIDFEKELKNIIRLPNKFRIENIAMIFTKNNRLFYIGVDIIILSIFIALFLQ